MQVLIGDPHDPLPHATPRVRLRRFAPRDLAPFSAYRRDPGTARYQGWNVMSDEAAAAFVAEMTVAPFCRPGTWFQVAIADAARDTLIGDIGVCVSASGDEAEVGFTLGPEHRGRGLATEAVAALAALVFAHRPVARIIGITDARNAASIRLLERIGMHDVSTTPTTFRGEPCVEITYELRRPRGPR